MQDPQTSHPMNRKLILVLDHDEQTGRQVVQAIQQETACQAMLATTLAEAQIILKQLKCDLVLLTSDAFAAKDLERLSRLPEEGELPARLSVGSFFWRSHSRNTEEVRSIVKAAHLLLVVRGGDGLFPLWQGRRRRV